jgi:hypothetical protein
MSSEIATTINGVIYDSDSYLKIIGFDTSSFPSDGIITTHVNTTSIENGAFNNCSKLISITMTSVVDIGNNAFSSCSNLTSVEFSSVLETIGETAFLFSTNLSGNIVLPSGLTTLGRDCFSNTNITQVNIPSAITHLNRTFWSCSSLTTVTLDNNPPINTISDAFGYCSSLTSFPFMSLPLVTINGSAFNGTGLTGIIQFPSTLQSITDGSAFANCPNITEARMTYSLDGVPTLVKYVYPDGELHKTVPMINFLNGNTANWIIVSTGQYINPILNGVIYETDSYLNIIGFDTSSFPSDGIITTHVNTTSIANGAFNNCSELISITMTSVVDIGNNAFSNCSNLTSVEFSSVLETIGEAAFLYSTNLSGNIVLPSGLTTLDRDAFFGCNNITQVNIPSSITHLNYTFYQCSSLTTVTLDNNPSIDTIGDAFQGCGSLTSFPFMSIPLVTINGSAFNGSGLTGIVEFPNTLQSITDGSAFANCPNITEAHMTYSLDGVPTLMKYVYPVGELHKTAPMIDFLNGNTANWEIVILLDGVIYESNNYLSITGYNNATFPTNGIVHLHINSEIILDSAFNGCSTMKAVIIPPSVTTVGNQAFDNCTQLTLVIMYKSNILYMYNFTESSDKTLIIQTFLSSSASELDEEWKKSTVSISPVINDTDVAIETHTITDLDLNGISTLVSTIFKYNSGLFDQDENKISFSAPGSLVANTAFADINPNIASQSITMFSSDISTTIDWFPTTTANAYVLLDKNGSTITINMDDGISVVLIKGETTTSVTINDGNTLQYTSGDTFTIGTTTCIIGSLIMYTEIPEPIIFSNICVRGTELVRTDNMGYKPIAALSVKDTLQGGKIQRIYRTKLKSGNLVLIKKDALGLYRPFKDTVVTKDHQIKVRTRLIPARQLITNMSFPDVVEYKYNGEILYNVLMVNHNIDKTMVINGLVCETLSGNYMRSKPIHGCLGFSNQKVGN